MRLYQGEKTEVGSWSATGHFSSILFIFSTYFLLTSFFFFFCPSPGLVSVSHLFTYLFQMKTYTVKTLILDFFYPHLIFFWRGCCPCFLLFVISHQQSFTFFSVKRDKQKCSTARNRTSNLANRNQMWQHCSLVRETATSVFLLLFRHACHRLCAKQQQDFWRSCNMSWELEVTG